MTRNAYHIRHRDLWEGFDGSSEKARDDVSGNPLAFGVCVGSDNVLAIIQRPRDVKALYPHMVVPWDLLVYLLPMASTETYQDPGQ